MDSAGKRAPKTIERRLGLASLLVMGVALGAGCSKPAAAPVGTSSVPMTGAEGTPADFDFDSLDGRPVSSVATRGKVTVLAFVTTWDVASQGQVDFLVAMAKNDGERVFYGLVAMQDRKDRELIEVYKSNLGVTFPVALASPELMHGAGPFGSMQVVPTVIVLDRQGRVVWRSVGMTKSDEIRRAMRGL